MRSMTKDKINLRELPEKAGWADPPAGGDNRRDGGYLWPARDPRLAVGPSEAEVFWTDFLADPAPPARRQAGDL